LRREARLYPQTNNPHSCLPPYSANPATRPLLFPPIVPNHFDAAAFPRCRAPYARSLPQCLSSGSLAPHFEPCWISCTPGSLIFPRIVQSYSTITNSICATFTCLAYSSPSWKGGCSLLRHPEIQTHPPLTSISSAAPLRRSEAFIPTDLVTIIHSDKEVLVWNSNHGTLHPWPQWQLACFLHHPGQCE
jgi:hypothetical protein